MQSSSDTWATLAPASGSRRSTAVRHAGPALVVCSGVVFSLCWPWALGIKGGAAQGSRRPCTFPCPGVLVYLLAQDDICAKPTRHPNQPPLSQPWKLHRVSSVFICITTLAVPFFGRSCKSIVFEAAAWEHRPQRSTYTLTDTHSPISLKQSATLMYVRSQLCAPAEQYTRSALGCCCGVGSSYRYLDRNTTHNFIIFTANIAEHRGTWIPKYCVPNIALNNLTAKPQSHFFWLFGFFLNRICEVWFILYIVLDKKNRIEHRFTGRAMG